jgi:hypothetical protein
MIFVFFSNTPEARAILGQKENRENVFEDMTRDVTRYTELNRLKKCIYLQLVRASSRLYDSQTCYNLFGEEMSADSCS